LRTTCSKIGERLAGKKSSATPKFARKKIDAIAEKRDQTCQRAERDEKRLGAGEKPDKKCEKKRPATEEAPKL